MNGCRGAIWGGAGYTLAPLFFSVSNWPGLKFTMRRRHTGAGPWLYGYKLKYIIKIKYYIIMYM